MLELLRIMVIGFVAITIVHVAFWPRDAGEATGRVFAEFRHGFCTTAVCR